MSATRLHFNIVYSFLQETSFYSAFLLLSLYLQWYLLTNRLAVLREKIIGNNELEGMWKLVTQIYFMLLYLHQYTVSLCTDTLYHYVLTRCITMYWHAVSLCTDMLYHYVPTRCITMYRHAVSLCTDMLYHYVLIHCITMYWYAVSLCTVSNSTCKYFTFSLINLHEGDIWKSASGTVKAHAVLCYTRK